MNPEENRSSGETDKVLRTVIKRFLQKYTFKLWTAPSEHGNKFSGTTKKKEFLEKLSEYNFSRGNQLHGLA
jgi:hypothetical protein